MADEGLAHTWSHEEVKGRDGLTSMLFVLIGLEDDGRKCSIALDALRCADAPVLRMEAPLK